MSDLFELLDESELPDACTWRVQRIDTEGRIHEHLLRLSWADYDLFAPCGAIPPIRVAEAVTRYFFEQAIFQPLPGRLDAAIPRRRIPGADGEIQAMIRG
ncbi:MAG: hypothetical protein MK085_05860 [Phycisphaerales bacterium]|nr:hypothetical protein [Phycisphaerales bacterium]